MAAFGESANQGALAAATATLLYTVPDSKNVILSVVFTERGGAATTVRLQLRRGGAASGDGQYLMYNVALPANTVVGMNRISTNETDEIWVEAASANVTANVLIDEVKQLV